MDTFPDLILEIILDYLSNTQLLKMRLVSLAFHETVSCLFARRCFKLSLRNLNVGHGLASEAVEQDGIIVRTNYTKVSATNVFTKFMMTMGETLTLKYKHFKIHFHPSDLPSLSKMIVAYGNNIYTLELHMDKDTVFEPHCRYSFFMTDFIRLFAKLTNVVSLKMDIDKHLIFHLPFLDTSFPAGYVQFELPKLVDLHVFNYLPNHLNLLRLPSLKNLNITLHISKLQDTWNIDAAFEQLKHWKCIIIVNILFKPTEDNPLPTVQALYNKMFNIPLHVNSISFDFQEFLPWQINLQETIRVYQDIIFRTREILYSLSLSVPRFQDHIAITLPNLPALRLLEIPICVKYASGINQHLFDNTESLRLTDFHDGSSYFDIRKLKCTFEVDVIPFNNIFPNLNDLWIENCTEIQIGSVFHVCQNLEHLQITLTPIDFREHDWQKDAYPWHINAWQRILAGFEHPDTIFSQVTALQMQGLNRDQAYQRINTLRWPSLISLKKLKTLKLGVPVTDTVLQLTILEMQSLDLLNIIPLEVSPGTVALVKAKCKKYN